jgi:hypothetical protein
VKKSTLVISILVVGAAAALIAVLAGVSAKQSGHLIGGLPAVFGVLVAGAIVAVTVVLAIVAALLPIGRRAPTPADGPKQESAREPD